MTHNGLGSLWMIAAVLAAIVVSSIALHLRERAVRRRNSVLDVYARQQLALRSLKRRLNPTHHGSVLPARRAL